jgi:hypothetical protein
MMFRVRRRFPRVSSDNAVLVMRQGDGGREHFGKLHSLGAGGCGFTTEERLGVGATLGLLIAFPQGTARAGARVVYERPSVRSPGVEVGVEFTSLSVNDRALITGVLRGARATVVS